MQLSQENRKAQKETSILSKRQQHKHNKKFRIFLSGKNGGSEFWLGFLK